MKIAEINGGVFGSTGRIMFGITDALTARGNEVLCFSPVTQTNRDREPDHPYEKIGTYFGRRLCVMADRITGYEGTAAVLQTKSLLSRLSQFDPDVIHLHTFHGSCLNIPMLFSFIKHRNIRLVWTLHDCWSFTGHCPHFEDIGCEKWKDGCYSCPRYREYPMSFFDNSKKMWRLKKRWFTGVEKAVIVTPSQWLASKVSQSYLKDYECQVINNGIDMGVFKPADSNFKKRYNITDKFMILGVSFGWGDAKGLDVFIELAKRLPEQYRIVLVGTDDEVDKLLPDNIISIHMTQNQQELAEVYSGADIFLNATRQDTFPTVNIESLACGTPVITFRTGGSPETIDEATGIVVPKDDVDAMYKSIIDIANNKPFASHDCVERARNNFDKKEKFEEYAALIERVGKS